MKPNITDSRRIILVGMDFYGDPYREDGGWSAQNAIAQLWNRFNDFYKEKKESIKHLASEAVYELWVDFEGEEDPRNKYIFIGVEIEKLYTPPLEMVVRILPETRYAVFTLEGGEIKADWKSKVLSTWLADAGLEQSHAYIIEYYDPQRFKGIDSGDSQLDIYVPIR